MNSKVKYGIIGGIVFFLWLLVEYYAGLYSGPYPSIMRYLFFYLVIIYFSVNQQKKKQGSAMKLTDGFKAGVATAVIVSVISAIGTYLYYNWINEKAITHYAEETRALWQKQNIDPEQIQDNIILFTKNFPSQASLLTLVLLLFSGITLSLIVSLVIKNVKQRV